MTDTVVVGIDHHREWMLQVITCDCISGERSDFMAFFNTRAEAETRLEQIADGNLGRNAIVKIVKIRAFEHLPSCVKHLNQVTVTRDVRHTVLEIPLGVNNPTILVIAEERLPPQFPPEQISDDRESVDHLLRMSNNISRVISIHFSTPRLTSR